MPHKILVTYATRTGVTQEIASSIAQAMQTIGDIVDVKPIQAVTGLNEYDAVFLGSSIRYGNWLPEAKKFVETQRQALGQKPLAVFTVHSLNLDDSETSRANRQGYHAALRALVSPKAEAFFAGSVITEKLNLFERTLAKMIKSPPSAGPDFPKIQAWAVEAQSKLLN